MAVSRIAAAEGQLELRPQDDRFDRACQDEADVLAPARGIVFAALAAIPFWLGLIAAILALS